MFKKAYTFDDVLLVPKKTSLTSRDEVNLEVNLGKDIKLNSPIISANMKTVTGPKMAAELALLGGLGLLHRFTEDRITDYNDSSFQFQKKLNETQLNIPFNVGMSIGIQESEKEFIDKVANETDCKILCLDIAHAHSENCLRFVEWISNYYPSFLLIAGNVATGMGAVELAEAGADVVKVGIGSSAICSTRVQTGNGVPQLTAIMDAAHEIDKRKLNVKLISDGGLKTVGSICKALCFTDAVMLGTMLAGCEESPGKIIDVSGVKYKEYIGSSTYKQRYIEGVTSQVKYSGYLKDIVESIHDGVRSCCSYQGVRNLNDLKINPEFVEISNAGLIESKTHERL
jgi:IMP dehydrogenase